MLMSCFIFLLLLLLGTYVVFKDLPIENGLKKKQEINNQKKRGLSMMMWWMVNKNRD